MDFSDATALIERSENILITTHTRPDGDACGCIVALANALGAEGKNVSCILLSPVPDWYSFLFDKKPLVLGQDIKTEDLDGLDLIILVDVNCDNQLPGFADYIKNKRDGAKVLVFDHHVTNDGLGDIELNDTSAAATGLLIYDFLKAVGWPVTENIATALFVATATDTGWFQFSNTNARVFETCAKLMGEGANATDVYRQLYHSYTEARFRLMVTMLNNLELHLDGRYAVQHLMQADFENTGANLSDTENLIDECRRIKSIEVSALFVEQKDGRVRGSLRSSGRVDVRKIAQKFDGGGHTMAAGLFLPGPIEEAKQKIFSAVQEQLCAV